MRKIFLLPLLFGYVSVLFAQEASSGKVFKVCTPRNQQPCATAPRPISTPDPQYTEAARKAKVQGTTVLWLIVDNNGSVKDPKVARSLDPGLDQEAIKAVKNWKFAPSTIDGKPVAVQINVEINFRLTNNNTETEAANTQPTLWNSLALGVTLLLPEGWHVMSEQPPTFSRPAIVVLNKPGTLARAAVMHERLEASPEVYLKAMSAFLDKRDDNRKLRDEPITRDGITGRHLEETWTEKGIPFRGFTEIFTSGQEHYTVSEWATEESFANYQQSFNEMLSSLQFNALHVSNDQILPEKSKP